jgi:uncharacterized membrane protein YfcA
MALFLIIFSFFTAAISAVTGMGGGVILLSVMTLFFSLEVVIPIHGFVQWISNSSRSYILRNKICWPLAIPFFFGAPLGTLLSYFIIKKLPSPTIPLLIISLLIFYTVFRPKRLPPLIIPRWGFFFLGFSVGILSLLIGVTGPLIAPFFLRPDLEKENIIATKAVVQMVAHVLKIPAFLVLGFPYENHLTLIIFLTLFTILGTRWGLKILHRINEQAFIILFKSALLITGLRILYKIFIVS